jgi:hypothetical protein
MIEDPVSLTYRNHPVHGDYYDSSHLPYLLPLKSTVLYGLL